MKNLTTKDICYTSLFTATMIVCGWISWDMGGVQGYSLQLLAVYVCAGTLGAKRGTIAVIVYILSGAIGMPVFAGFSAGLFSSPTRGYVVGFIPAAFVTGACERFYDAARRTGGRKKVFLFRVVVMFAATLLCYAFGTAWFLAYVGIQGRTYSLIEALCLCVLPYLPFDLVKILSAAGLTERLKGRF